MGGGAVGGGAGESGKYDVQLYHPPGMFGLATLQTSCVRALFKLRTQGRMNPGISGVVVCTAREHAHVKKRVGIDCQPIWAGAVRRDIVHVRGLRERCEWLGGRRT